MSNATLQSDNQAKDLGVIIDSELKLHKHIVAAINKASRMLGLVRPTFTCLDESTLPSLYTTTVRPHLEYGNVFWSPRYKLDMNEIEKIHRKATKLVPNLRRIPYEEGLVTLKLPSLLNRRRRGDMIQAFRIVKGIDRIDSHICFPQQPEPTIHRKGH